MYIEDILYNLESHCRGNRLDVNVISSLSLQVNFNGAGFTEKQAQLALKLIKRYIGQLNVYYGKDISSYIATPTYRLPIRVSSLSNRKISVISHAQWEKAVKVEFPYNEDFITLIKSNKSNSGFAMWDKEHKAWIFALSESNIQTIKKLIEKDHFEIDEEFKKYLIQCNEVIGKIENYMPMLVIEENVPKYVNLPKYAPTQLKDDLLTSVFEARKIGVSIWDDTIEKFLSSDKVDPLVYTFLKSDPVEIFHLDSENIPMNHLKNIVQYLEPGLFIIPGGMEFEKTQMAYNFLKDNGVDNSEISIMFRLPSGTGQNFNEFVKINNLNNPISEKTKYVFISTKIPKPVLLSKAKFNCVISLGSHNMHYTIRDFQKNCQNFIYYCEQRPNKELSFGNM
jgi:hypothetical protein